MPCRLHYRFDRLVACVAVCCLSLSAADGQQIQSDNGKLALNATIQLPDGSPAAHASVEIFSQWVYDPLISQADQDGRVQIHDVFGNGVWLYARSADGRFQTTMRVGAQEARLKLEKSFELKLAPAIDHRVTVTANGQPAAGVPVVAAGSWYRVRATTGQDGSALLQLPDGERLRNVSALDVERGVAAESDLEKRPPQDTTQLSLLPPAPAKIRVIDFKGKPVSGLELCVSASIKDSGWIEGRDLPAARAHTDDNGEATIPWVPRDNLNYCYAEIVGAGWKVDDVDFEKAAQRVVTLHVRRLKPVTGKLTLPDGASAEGLLITGHGFGPGHTGTIPQVRARRDGTFTFNAASDHAYALGVLDREWGSMLWSGIVLTDDDAQPASIKIPVRSGTLISIRVTRGPEHEPVPNATIEFQENAHFVWQDLSGKRRSGTAGLRNWLTTDAKGFVFSSVGSNQVELRLVAEKWEEKRTVKLNPDEPNKITFHRGWIGDRKVTARMQIEGQAYEPSSKLETIAWTERKLASPIIHQSKVQADGSIEVIFDEEQLSLLAIDRERHLSGLVKVGLDKTSVFIPMRPTASLKARLVDENAQPLSNRKLVVTTVRSMKVTQPQTTDDQGRFQFTGLPSGVSLVFQLEQQDGQEPYDLYWRKSFDPGESGEDEVRAVRRKTDAKN